MVELVGAGVGCQAGLAVVAPVVLLILTSVRQANLRWLLTGGADAGGRRRAIPSVWAGPWPAGPGVPSVRGWGLGTVALLAGVLTGAGSRPGIGRGAARTTPSRNLMILCHIARADRTYMR